MTEDTSSTAGPAQETPITEVEGTQEASSPSVEQEATPAGDEAPASTEAELVEGEGDGPEATEDGTTYIAQI